MTAFVSLAREWTRKERILFRFFAAYFIITLFPFPLNVVPVLDVQGEALSDRVWDPLIGFTAHHLLHIPDVGKPPQSGSGDTTYHYIQQVIALVCSLLTCIAWSIGSRKKSYHRLLLYITLLVRYYLAFTMFYYGFCKVFPTQFPFPSLYTLLEPYGQSSPMRLAWSFMGYSQGYNLFTGLAEVLAGSLLFFRKTTLAGALLAVIVMANVLAMNLSFDIPVKLYAMNLIVMGLFLLAPHASRLYDLFIRNKPVTPLLQEQLFTGKQMQRISILLKVIVIGGAFYLNIKDNYGYLQEYRAKPPLYGIYDTDSFVRNNTSQLPLQTDSSRWKKLIIDHPGYAGIQLMNDSLRHYRMETDTLKKQLLLFLPADTLPVYSFYYSLAGPDIFLLEGTQQQDSLQIQLKRFDLNRFNLINRGFHWISEYPYNR